jgi:hypothetical protein
MLEMKSWYDRTFIPQLFFFQNINLLVKIHVFILTYLTNNAFSTSQFTQLLKCAA